MDKAIKTVAILASSPALSSILASVLALNSGLRVRSFETQRALVTYMHLTSVDLVVLDYDCPGARADKVAQALRMDEKLVFRGFQIIAMTRTLSSETREATMASGIDEVIIKPMSPRYLYERVLSRLSKPARPTIIAGGYHGPERRSRPRDMDIPAHALPKLGENVVSLFPQH